MKKQQSTLEKIGLLEAGISEEENKRNALEE